MDQPVNPAAHVAAAIFAQLSIDKEWTLPALGGYSWLPYALAQTITATEPADDNGILIAKLQITSDFLRGVRRDQLASAALLEVAAQLGVAGLLAEPDIMSGGYKLKLATSMWVTEQTSRWLAVVMPTIAMMQTYHAHTFAPRLEHAGLGTVDASSHPASGRRETPDEFLLSGPGYAREFGSNRHPDAAMRVEGLRGVFARLKEHPYCLGVTASDGALAAQFSFSVPGTGPHTSLLKIDHRSILGDFGSGLSFTLELPVADVLPRAGLPAYLELNKLTQADLGGTFLRGIGGWGQDGNTLKYSVFYPDVTWDVVAAENYAMYEAHRAMWVAMEVYDSRWHGYLSKQRELLAMLREIRSDDASAET